MPEGKRTSLGLYATAAEAYERWTLWPAKVSPDHGRRLVNGWKNAGLPWTCEIDPELIRLPRLT